MPTKWLVLTVVVVVWLLLSLALELVLRAAL
jgi:hypothetical protein